MTTRKTYFFNYDELTWDTVADLPPEASEEWVEALKRENKVFEYKTYATEPHGFLQRKNLLDVYERMERFLDWYLLPK
jgi:dipeptidyl aminopeptidase/acylaminoacyl peptidase